MSDAYAMHPAKAEVKIPNKQAGSELLKSEASQFLKADRQEYGILRWA
jgi:hypothetical protein